MKYLILSWMILLGFGITAFAAPIQFTSGPSSVLPSGARIIAGDLSKNEFFIVSANENMAANQSQVATPAPVVASSSIANDKQIVSELKMALNKTFKPQAAPTVNTNTLVAQKNKPIMQITIHSHVIAMHKNVAKKLIHPMIAVNKPHKIIHAKKVAVIKIKHAKKVAVIKIKHAKKVAMIKAKHDKKVAIAKVNYKKLANAFSKKFKMNVDKRMVPHSLADADQFIKHISPKKNAKVKVAMSNLRKVDKNKSV